VIKTIKIFISIINVIKKTMDPDDSKTVNYTKRNVSNVSDVLSAFWLRCNIQIHNGYNWVVLGRRYRFLLCFGIFIYIVFFIKEVIK